MKNTKKMKQKLAHQHGTQIETLPVTAGQLPKESRQDRDLSKVMSYPKWLAKKMLQQSYNRMN